MFDWSAFGFRITSPYGYRNDPFTGNATFHTGIDLVKAHKAPIFAFASGEVVHAREGQAGTGFGGFGVVVAIKDERGALHCYAHLDSCSVKVGQPVKAGQEVGKQGTTGRSTGSHLHYEVRTKSTPSYGFGAHTNPGEYLEKHAVKEPEKASVELNGKKICDGTFKNGLVTVLIRDIADALGAKLVWDHATKNATVNGKKIVGVQVVNDRAVAPVREVVEAAGGKVTAWDGLTRKVSIQKR
ncbi:peptidoglycan DD-metalloendopeptidase family protein [Paenibacillus sp. MER 180]|uniref:peptidoglycan DD-metalloendopeptidase family protein n=1 Tax=Paenibacillus sp. MER 180 TaxID=2939570 RepID=UPI002559E55D|nr:peptidoglycan DD-metalloendopeptidase family protein [Paenibacillus sp. MER 180]